MGHMMAKDTVNPLSIAVLTGNKARSFTEMKNVLSGNLQIIAASRWGNQQTKTT